MLFPCRPRIFHVVRIFYALSAFLAFRRPRRAAYALVFVRAAPHRVRERGADAVREKHGLFAHLYSIPIMRTNPYKKDAHEGTSGAGKGDYQATKRWSHHIKRRRMKEWPLTPMKMKNQAFH